MQFKELHLSLSLQFSNGRLIIYTVHLLICFTNKKVFNSLNFHIYRRSKLPT